MTITDTLKGMKFDVPSLLVGSAAGAAVGGGSMYLVYRLALQRRYRTALDQEVAAVKAHYNDRLKAHLSGIVSHTPDTGVPIMGQPGGDDYLAGGDGDGELGETALGIAGDERPAPGVRLKSVPARNPLEGLEGGEEDPDDAANRELDEAGGSDPGAAGEGLVARDIDHPYVISLEEFCDVPPGWQQITLTYFNSGGTLVDDKNEPIPNYSKLTGKIRGPQDFGGISDDEHIRYVRNQAMETDFEILFDPRSYADGVLNYGQPNKGG